MLAMNVGWLIAEMLAMNVGLLTADILALNVDWLTVQNLRPMIWFGEMDYTLK